MVERYISHSMAFICFMTVSVQEMEFIAGLVRVGTIPQKELEAVLHQLYPNKTEQEFKEIFDKIFDPNLQPKPAPGESLEQ